MAIAVSTSPDGKQGHFDSLNVEAAELLNSESYNHDVVYTPGLGRDTRRGDTYVVGKFRCLSKSCKKKNWASGKVYVEFFFAVTAFSSSFDCGIEFGSGGFLFDVIVWGQACKDCKSIAVPNLDAGVYSNRVQPKLRLFMGLRDCIEHKGSDKETPPHRSDLCYACRAGKCRQARK